MCLIKTSYNLEVIRGLGLMHRYKESILSLYRRFNVMNGIQSDRPIIQLLKLSEGGQSWPPLASEAKGGYGSIYYNKL